MNIQSHVVKPLSVAVLTSLSLMYAGSVFAVAGKFQFVNGEVQVIEAGGAAHKVQKGDGINEGDTVSAASDGFAQIKMEDGGFFAVRSDTQFKVDTFKYEGKEDGSEQGVFSLIKGSLRSVTGIIGKKHRDNYKIQTATSVIGIRGSGADVGHSDSIGTAVRTLFGGHSLTSAGKTIVTGPGQIALAPPGEAPKIVPSFPFSTSTSASNGGNGDKSASNGDKGKGDKGKSDSKSESKESSSENNAAPETAPEVVIAIKTTDGTNLTENKTADGGNIGSSATHPATGNYGHEVVGPYPLSGGGYSVYNPFSDSQPNTSYLFDSNNNLVEVDSGYGASAYTSTAKFSGGVAKETFKSSDGSVYLGRWVGGSATNTYTGNYAGESNNASTLNLGAGSLHWLVSVNPASGFVQSLQGTSNYSVFAKTSPTDALGNVGHLLDTSSLTADFTNQKVNMSLYVNFETGNSAYVSSKNKSFAITTPQGISISGDHAWGSGSVTCTGADCSSYYYSSLWARFAGADASYNALAYNIDGNSDLVQGVAAFKAASGSLPAGNYIHFISAVKSNGFVAEQGAGGMQTYGSSNYTFSSDGGLTGVAASKLDYFDSGSTSILSNADSSLTATGGTISDTYHTPDNSIYLGRGSNVTVTTTCSVCSSTPDNFVSAQTIVAIATAPALVQTLTGTTSYTLAGSTHPVDMAGHVGTLNNASLSANFTNQTATYGVDLTINGKNLIASAANIPIVWNRFDAGDSAVTITGTGSSGYKGHVGGAILGTAAASAALAYSFWPTANTSGAYTDYIHGLVALTASTAPTATSSTAGIVGGGGAAVGSLGVSPGYFNDFNVVDNVNFAARHDLAGNVIAFNKLSSIGDFSFAASTATQDGADAANGVIWGRWASGYSANYDNNSGTNSSLAPIGGMSFITGAHITTAAEIANASTWTGSGLSNSGGVVTGTYSLATGSFPTIGTVANSGTVTSASASVNFTTSNISSFSVAGSGGDFGSWSASGSGSIDNFMAKNGATGLSLSGSRAATPTVSAASFTGTAVGAFVGTQAQGLISTIGLSNGTDKIGAAVYMKR